MISEFFGNGFQINMCLEWGKSEYMRLLIP